MLHVFYRVLRMLPGLDRVSRMLPHGYDVARVCCRTEMLPHVNVAAREIIPGHEIIPGREINAGLMPV